MLDWIRELHSHLIEPDRLPIAAAAVILSAFTGIIAGNILRGNNVNPLLSNVINAIFAPISNRLNRKDRGKADLVFRGFLVTILAVLLAYMLSLATITILNIPAIAKLRPYTDIIPLSLCLSSGGVWHMLLKLYRTMEKKQAGQGEFLALSRSSFTDLSSVDDFAITRTGMSFAARIFDKGLVSPVFWYLLVGLEGAFIYSALAALAHRYGKNGKPSGFGAATLAIEKLMGMIPSILAGTFLLLASAIAPTASLSKSIQFLIALALHRITKGAATYEQGGLAISSMSWALNVTLGGPAKNLNGESLQSSWVGPPTASAKTDPHHLRSTILIHVCSTLIFLATLGGAYLWSELLLDF